MFKDIETSLPASRDISGAPPLPDGAIQVRGVTLDYPVYRNLVWDRMAELLGIIVKSLRPPSKRVLDQIDLDVAPGEMVGFVGVNGAGKTSLLKVISGLVAPSGGEVRASGRVAALLAMGMGFRPNMTGRENIYYGGLLLGMRRRYIDRIFDELVDFAELGEAMDQPYFTYSSGMRGRLAFTLATSVPAEIIILDETLATGDRHFVGKCYRRIQDIRKSGRTILFVSHNLGEVARLTSRVVLLDKGCVLYDGPTNDGLAMYERLLLERTLAAQGELAPLTGVEVSLSMIGDDGTPVPVVEVAASVALRLCITAETDLGSCFIFLRMAELETDQLVTYVMPRRWVSLLDDFNADNNVEISAGVTEITWSLPHWVAGEGQFLFDVYVGPPVDPDNPDISGGRVWRRALTMTSTYANSYLKGAGCMLEFPVLTTDIRHSVKR